MVSEAELCEELDLRACQGEIANRGWITLPDLQTLVPHDLELKVSGNGARRILRFSNSVANIGSGVLELVGDYGSGNKIAVSQKLFRSDGGASVRDVGGFIFHPDHDHYHWEEFSVYEIWRVDAAGNLVEVVANSGKVGYCMIDISRIDQFTHGGGPLRGPKITERARYTGCGWLRQGISTGWIDTYDWQTPGQEVDVSNFRDGLYALISTVDPEGLLTEIDVRNNTAGVLFYLRGNEIFPLHEISPDDLPGDHVDSPGTTTQMPQESLR